MPIHGAQIGLITTAGNGFAVTPSDTVKLQHPTTKGIVTAADGTVACRLVNMADNATALSVTVVAGMWYPLNAKQILATGTTATGIIAFYDD